MVTTAGEEEAARKSGEQAREERAASGGQSQNAVQSEEGGKVKWQHDIQSPQSGGSQTTNEGGQGQESPD